MYVHESYREYKVCVCGVALPSSLSLFASTPISHFCIAHTQTRYSPSLPLACFATGPLIHVHVTSYITHTQNAGAEFMYVAHTHSVGAAGRISHAPRPTQKNKKKRNSPLFYGKFVSVPSCKRVSFYFCPKRPFFFYANLFTRVQPTLAVCLCVSCRFSTLPSSPHTRGLSHKGSQPKPKTKKECVCVWNKRRNKNTYYCKAGFLKLNRSSMQQRVCRPPIRFPLAILVSVKPTE